MNASSPTGAGISAAHHTLSDPDALARLLDGAADAARFYLSGISLALCGQSGRARLRAWLRQYRAAGGLVIYDSNYREALWSDRDSAREAHGEMLALTDVFLPGVADELEMQALEDKSALLEKLRELPLQEWVLKDGSAAVHGLADGVTLLHEPEPATRVVDTSGAGDAFNGGYLAARLRGLDAARALAFAGEVATATIAQRGALLPVADWAPLRQRLQELLDAR